MTRCMIREEFFESHSYKIDIKNEKDKGKMVEDRDAGKLGEPLVEFCLPTVSYTHLTLPTICSV